MTRNAILMWNLDSGHKIRRMVYVFTQRNDFERIFAYNILKKILLNSLNPIKFQPLLALTLLLLKMQVFILKKNSNTFGNTFLRTFW